VSSSRGRRLQPAKRRGSGQLFFGLPSPETTASTSHRSCYSAAATAQAKRETRSAERPQAKQRLLSASARSKSGRGVEMPTHPAGLDPIAAEIIEAVAGTIAHKDNNKRGRSRDTFQGLRNSISLGFRTLVGVPSPRHALVCAVIAAVYIVLVCQYETCAPSPCSRRRNSPALPGLLMTCQVVAIIGVIVLIGWLAHHNERLRTHASLLRTSRRAS
jgi:hypothetical protein